MIGYQWASLYAVEEVKVSIEKCRSLKAFVDF